MNKSLNRIICFVLSAVLAFIGTAYAAEKTNSGDAKDKLSSIEQELKEFEKQQKELQSKINELSKSSDNYDELRNSLDKKIQSIKDQTEYIDSEIKKLNAKIEENELDIYKRNERLYGAKEELKKRLRAIYVAGANSELLILLSAEDYSDFLARSELLRGVSDHDKKLMDSLAKEVGELNELKDQNRSTKEENAKMKAELEAKKKQYDTEYSEASAMLTKIMGQKTSLYEDQSELADVIAAKEKEAEEWRDVIKNNSRDFEFGGGEQQTTAKPTTTERTTTTKETQSDSDKTTQEPTQSTTQKTTRKPTTPPGVTITDDLIVSSKGFAWPFRTSYYISCPYGQREGRFHTGVDITCSKALGKPIYASAAGYVIRAKHSNVSYGNHLIIDHGKKNGNSYSTLYAHCQTLLVDEGDYVRQGQLIAYCGSTGNSSGPHLHFEVRVNGDYVNPFNYIPRP